MATKVARGIGGLAAKRAAANEGSCACNAGLWKAVEAKANCLPGKWASARAEAKEVFSRYKSGEVTYGELKQHAVFVLAGGLIFFAGEAVGRGSLVGYKG